MTTKEENPFRPKLGRIRSRGSAKKAKGYLSRVVRSASRAGGGISRTARPRRSAGAPRTFSRRVVIKARFVKLAGSGAKAQALHLRYIQRDGVTREGEKGRLYNATSDDVDGDAFLKRNETDRHQFRFIVSPEDGDQLDDLKPFIRDLMDAAERDLGTKLDWVAADHFNTEHPHTHIVLSGKRDDGRDLVIPREYIRHGFRTRAAELLTIELGPQTELEMRTRLAAEVRHERFTRLDRELLAATTDETIDLTKDGPTRWRERLRMMRLKKLEELGLAEKAGARRWHLSPELEPTLRRMGERGDIIKTMHRELAANGTERAIGADTIYDPGDPRAKPVEGRIIAKGLSDELNSRAYAIIDATDGRAVYVEIGAVSKSEDLKPGMVVRIEPPDIRPKPSDVTIDEIAQANGGRYSPSLHMIHDDKARPEFVEAHVRRLEAVRRAGHAERFEDGSWAVPQDYLDRAVQYERERAKDAPVKARVLSTLTIDAQVTAEGATWLDRRLAGDLEADLAGTGFGAEARGGAQARKRFLMRTGRITEDQAHKRLAQKVLRELERKDLADAARGLSKELGKPYSEIAQRGTVDGVYLRPVDRVSGRYALIERSKDFTLAPWRDVLERNRGKFVSGVIRGETITWTLTRPRGRTLG